MRTSYCIRSLLGGLWGILTQSMLARIYVVRGYLMNIC